jgi:hypothetical protein
VRTLVLNDEQPGDLPLDGRSDQHGSRLGCGLNPRGDIGRFPKHFAYRVDDDGATQTPLRHSRPATRYLEIDAEAADDDPDEAA